jgi:hypothetical protein
MFEIRTLATGLKEACTVWLNEISRCDRMSSNYFVTYGNIKTSIRFADLYKLLQLSWSLKAPNSFAFFYSRVKEMLCFMRRWNLEPTRLFAFGLIVLQKLRTLGELASMRCDVIKSLPLSTRGPVVVSVDDEDDESDDNQEIQKAASILSNMKNEVSESRGVKRGAH